MEVFVKFLKFVQYYYFYIILTFIHIIILFFEYTKDHLSKLLKKDTSDTIHHTNIRVLATEAYELLQELCIPLKNEIFGERNNNYSLHNALTR